MRTSEGEREEEREVITLETGGERGREGAEEARAGVGDWRRGRERRKERGRTFIFDEEEDEEEGGEREKEVGLENKEEDFKEDFKEDEEEEEVETTEKDSPALDKRQSSSRTAAVGTGEQSMVVEMELGDEGRRTK